MTEHNATQAVLRLFTDESGLPYAVALGWLAGSGAENERDAAKYVEGAARDILEDSGKSATALREAVGCDADASTFEVLSRIDWMVVGEYFFQQHVL